MVSKLDPSAGNLWFVKDHLGSTRRLNSSSMKRDYYPFGEDYTSAGSETDYQFTGKEKDNSELYYFGARYYDARIGRWLSVDPLAGKYPGLSPYVYTLDNPLNYTDPNGKETWPVKAKKIRKDGRTGKVGYFGKGARTNSKHGGVDILAPKGTPVSAYADGRIIKAGDGKGKAGIRIVIQHHDAKAKYSLYFHLSEVDPGIMEKIEKGEKVEVKEGQLIGKTGITGNAKNTPEHLHFELKNEQGEQINPSDQFSFWDKIVNWVKGRSVPETSAEKIKVDKKEDKKKE